MKKRNIGIPLTILSIGIWMMGCSGNTQTGTSLVDIEISTPINKLQELKLSEHFSRLRFIPLETPDEGLVGKGPLWKLTDQHLIVSNKQQCLLFDPETGKFLTAVGHVGNDPEGYQSGYATPDEKNNRLLFTGWDHDLVSYDFSGKYQEKIKLTRVENGTMDAYPSTVFPLKDNNLAGYYSQMFKDEIYRIIFYNPEGDSIASRLVPVPGEPIELNSISVFTQLPVEWIDPYVSLAELLDMQGMMFLTGKEEDTHSISVIGENPFWQYKEDVYMKELLDNTLYRIEGTELIPHRTFRFGDKTFSPAENINVGNDKSIYLSRVMEGEEFLLFRFAVSPYNFQERKDYNGIFNKKTGGIRINRIDHGFKDDIYDFIQLNPVAVSPSGTFVSVLQADDICDWIDEHGAESLPRELSHLANLREDDNPVIVLMD